LVVASLCSVHIRSFAFSLPILFLIHKLTVAGLARRQRRSPLAPTEQPR
jgi:hypothetical protein